MQARADGTAPQGVVGGAFTLGQYTHAGATYTVRPQQSSTDTSNILISFECFDPYAATFSIDDVSLTPVR